MKGTPTVSKDELMVVMNSKAKAFDGIKEAQKELEERRVRLRSELMDFCRNEGEKNDKKTLVVTAEYEIGIQHREKATLDHAKAEEVLKELDLWKKCSITTVSLDLNELNALIAEGKIEKKDVRKFLKCFTEEALFVKRRDQE